MKAAADKSTSSHQSRASADPVSQQPAPQGPALASPEKAEFEDNRPETMAQRKLQTLVNNSLQVAAQRRLQEAINNSPRMVAQRQRLAQWFGSAARIGQDVGERPAMSEAASIQRARGHDRGASEPLIQLKMEILSYSKKETDEGEALLKMLRELIAFDKRIALMRNDKDINIQFEIIRKEEMQGNAGLTILTTGHFCSETGKACDLM